MSEYKEFDINKIIAELLNENIKDLINEGKKILKGTKQTAQLTLKTIYSDYLKRIYERYGKSKSFFIRQNPVELYEFYIPMGLTCDTITINTANVKGIFNVNKYSIITGTGGAGKSIMLKHLFVDTLKQKKHIPIFVELRDIINTKMSLLDLIINVTENFGLNIERNFFLKAFKKGHFTLFLDGLDEVNKNRKLKLLKEIKNITIRYPNVNIVLTTRPDILMSELDVFSIFTIQPLTLDKSLQLIDKLPADEDLKNKFSKDLKIGLYEKHESFLSNPLLLSIMMLTYGYSADIPNKSSIFYNQAFEALFQRHDSFKGAYKRKRETNLDIQEFSKVFSIFCILTYEDRKSKFTKDEVISYLQNTKSITDLEFDNDAFYVDLLQSVSLLIEDGMSVYFTHRSFQEYFASKFIVESEKDLKISLLNKYMKYARTDDVFELSREQDKDFIDFEIIQPFIDKLKDEIGLKKNIGITNYLRYIKKMWSKFEFRAGNLIGVSKDVKCTEMMFFILRNVTPELTNKELGTSDRSDWIRSKKEDSLNISNKTLIFETSSLKTTDVFVKELYKHGKLFSSISLKILMIFNNQIKERKKTIETSLAELLLKK